MDEDGFVSIMARTDDVINVAGHRISTKSLEEVQLDIFHFFLLAARNNWFFLLTTRNNWRSRSKMYDFC